MAKPAKKSSGYYILDLTIGEIQTDYNNNIMYYKTEEEAYENLLRDRFTTWQSRERNLQILLLVSELAKTDLDIGYKMFLTKETKNVKPYNHVTVMAYLKKNKLCKHAFKCFCDMVAIMGLAHHNVKCCFEHFEVILEESKKEVSCQQNEDIQQL